MLPVVVLTAVYGVDDMAGGGRSLDACPHPPAVRTKVVRALWLIECCSVEERLEINLPIAFSLNCHEGFHLLLRSNRAMRLKMIIAIPRITKRSMLVLEAGFCSIKGIPATTLEVHREPCLWLGGCANLLEAASTIFITSVI